MTDPLPRSDARDNRGRILHAADVLFAAGDLDVPIREIARHAQVAPATVYRHFPNKQMLLAAAFIRQSRAWHAALQDGLAHPDPWCGLRRAISRLCELQARDRGFTAAFKSAFPRAVDFTGLRTLSLMSASALFDRAKDAGHVRAEIGLDDLLLMLTASSGILASNPAARTATSRRYAELTTLALRNIHTDPHNTPAANCAGVEG